YQFFITRYLQFFKAKQIITHLNKSRIEGTQMRHSVSVTCCALLVSSISLSWAADVPDGTVLAKKQEIVRHIKDEPATLDPAKAVGLPEIQVIRDLFEGLV